MTKRQFISFAVVVVAMVTSFAAGWLTGRTTISKTITITPELRQSLAITQMRTLGRAPTDTELEGAVQRYIDDEVLFREALRLQLDKGDPVIRRRLVQSMQLHLESDVFAKDPSDDILAAYAANNPLPGSGPKIGFEHRFFSSERRGERAFGDADAATGSSDRGDPFIHGHRFVDVPRHKIASLFGDRFAKALTAYTEQPPQRPIASEYGWHVIDTIHIRQTDWTANAKDYRTAWHRDQREQAIAAGVQELKQTYRIQTKGDPP